MMRDLKIFLILITVVLILGAINFSLGADYSLTLRVIQYSIAIVAGKFLGDYLTKLLLVGDKSFIITSYFLNIKILLLIQIKN